MGCYRHVLSLNNYVTIIRKKLGIWKWFHHTQNEKPINVVQEQLRAQEICEIKFKRSWAINNCHVKSLSVPHKIYLPLVNQLGCYTENEQCLSELDPGGEAQVAGWDVGSAKGLVGVFFSVQGEMTLVRWPVNSAYQHTRIKTYITMLFIWCITWMLFIGKTFGFEKVSALNICWNNLLS